MPEVQGLLISGICFLNLYFLKFFEIFGFLGFCSFLQETGKLRDLPSRAEIIIAGVPNAGGLTIDPINVRYSGITISIGHFRVCFSLYYANAYAGAT